MADEMDVTVIVLIGTRFGNEELVNSRDLAALTIRWTHKSRTREKNRIRKEHFDD